MEEKSIILTGAVCYDYIMTFPDKFEKHIIPDKIHMLNVSFDIDKLNLDFGGVAGNIAYGLHLLNKKSTIWSTGGSDFNKYKNYLNILGLSSDNIKILENEKTAQAFITTDLSDNQITAFYSGAIAKSYFNPLINLNKNSIIMISPNNVTTMLSHAEYCQNNEIDFIFDPGQSFNALNAENLVKITNKSKLLIMNDYEWELWKQKTWLNKNETLKLTKSIIITLANNGVKVIEKNEEYSFKAVKNLHITDPTGAGDSFRSGLLYRLSKGYSLKDSVKLANAVASFCVEKMGTQNHKINMNLLKKRYQDSYGEDLIL